MSIGLLYWILMLLWLVLGVRASWPRDGSGWTSPGTGGLLIFTLLLLLGWQVFGSPIHH